MTAGTGNRTQISRSRVSTLTIPDSLKECHINHKGTSHNPQGKTTYLQVIFWVSGKYIFPWNFWFPVKFCPDTWKHWGFALRITKCHLYELAIWNSFRFLVRKFRGLLTPSPQHSLNQIRKSWSSEFPLTRSPPLFLACEIATPRHKGIVQVEVEETMVIATESKWTGFEFRNIIFRGLMISQLLLAKVLW